MDSETEKVENKCRTVTSGRLKLIKSDLKSFLDTTSAHGLGQLPNSRSILIKIFWCFVFLAAFSFVLWKGYYLLHQFQSRPTITSTTYSFEKNLVFPVVVVCNQNPIKENGYNRLFDKDGLENLAFSEILKHFQDFDTITLQNEGHLFKELINQCYFRGFNCKTGEGKKYWTQFWHWKYGNCYTFNSGKDKDGNKLDLLNITQPGPEEGLRLRLNINQSQYVGKLSSEAGARISVSTQGQLLAPYFEGFSLAPGMAYYIALKKEQIERADPFNNGSCYDNNVDGSPGNYSIGNCMYSCLSLMQKQRCNCSDYKLPNPQHICLTWKEEKCSAGVTADYRLGNLPCLNCTQACREIKYTTSISANKFPSKKTIETRVEKGMVDAQSWEDDYMRILLYFDQLAVLRSTETTYYTFEKFMGDFGGLLSLCTGVSLLTGAEVLILILSCLSHLMIGNPDGNSLK